MNNNKGIEFVSFDRAAGLYDKTRAVAPSALTDFVNLVIDNVTTKKSPLILDIGVGTGRIARFFQNVGYKIIGIDVSAKMIHAGNYQGYSRPDLICADARSIPIRYNQCDAIILIHILHLIRNWKKVLQEALRVLKNDGTLVTGKIYAKPEKEVFYSTYYDYVTKKGIDTGHIGVKNLQEIENFLKQQNYRTISVQSKTFNHSGDLLDLVNCFDNCSFSTQWSIPLNIHKEAMKQLKKGIKEESGEKIALQSVIEIQFFSKD